MSDEVSVFSWLLYFLLALLVSTLSLHQTRCESNLQIRKSKKGKTRQIFLILRRRQVSLMDQSLVVCLATSGIALSTFIFQYENVNSKVDTGAVLN